MLSEMFCLDILLNLTLGPLTEVTIRPFLVIFIVCIPEILLRSSFTFDIKCRVSK